MSFVGLDEDYLDPAWPPPGPLLFEPSAGASPVAVLDCLGWGGLLADWAPLLADCPLAYYDDARFVEAPLPPPEEEARCC